MLFTIGAADGSFEIVWDSIGLPHIFAGTVADAYRGMGFAAGSQRLWQMHLSTLYANGEVASVLGERFVKRDAMQRAFNVPGRLTGLPASEGESRSQRSTTIICGGSGGSSEGQCSLRGDWDV